MAVRLHVGNKTGVGPVVKFMRDSADDPQTTPNTAYGKFLFNSEVTYNYIEQAVTITVDPKPATNGDYHYLPAGRTVDDYVMMFRKTGIVSGIVYYTHVDVDLVKGGFDLSRILIQQTGSLDGWFSKYTSLRDRYYNGSNSDNNFIHSWATAGAADFSYKGDWSNMNHWHGPFSIDHDGTETYQCHVGGYGLTGQSDGPVYRVQNFSDASRTRAMFPYYGTDAGEAYVWKILQTRLPAGNETFPPAAVTPVAGQTAIRIDADTFKIARPGFDADTATGDELIIDSDHAPIAVAASGVVTIAANTTASITIAAPIGPNALVDYHVGLPGDPLYIPPIFGDFTSGTNLDISYRITGQVLEIKSAMSFAVEVTYVVFDGPVPGQSSGDATGSIIRKGAGYMQVVRPGAGATPVAQDILLDSRRASLPMVANGWITRDQLAATPTDASDPNRAPCHKFTIPLTND